MTEPSVKKPKLNLEIATTGDGKDITRPYINALMMPDDKVLKTRGRGNFDIYKEVLSDDQVKSSFQQIQLGITKHAWEVKPGGDRPIDKLAAEFIKEQVKTIGFDNITTKMLYGVFYGFAVSEIIYQTDGRYITLKAIKVRDRRRFRFNSKGELRLLTMSSMLEGIPCRAPYFWHYATGSDHDDEPYGLGLAHYLYWPVFFKRNGMKFWAMFMEKFAMPTAIGEFPVNATPVEQDQLLQALMAITVDSGIAIPTGAKISLLEAARNGTGDYKAFLEAMNDAIAKTILGQTASTQGTPGKLGNDELQGDVLDNITQAYSDLINESFTLNVIKWLVQWNFPGAAIPEITRNIEKQEDISERAKRDQLVFSMSGKKPTTEYLVNTYGVEIDENSSNTTDDIAANLANFAEVIQPQRDAPAIMTDRLAKEMQPVINKWGKEIEAIVSSSESLQEIEQRLLALAPNLSLDDYVKVASQALTAAKLAGFNDVTDEVSDGNPS